MEIRWKNEWTVPTVVGAVSFGVGIGVGYAIRSYKERRFVRSFDQIMEEAHEKENDEMGLLYDLNDMVPSEWVEDTTVTVNPEDIEFEVVTSRSIVDSISVHPSNSHNVFSNTLDEDGWDYEEEMKTRTPDAPYIIHVDEYEDNEKEFSQSTLTYYRGDNVLCDENDMPIYNHEKIASPLIFGKGSRDPSIVYICNEKLEALYEVLLETGYFQVEVLGEEIENSFDKKKEPLPKFRPE